MRRFLALAVLVLGATLGGVSVPAGSGAGSPAPVSRGVRPTATVLPLASAASAVGPAAGSYRPPVAGPVQVLRGFSPPATPYGAGHLGVDLASQNGDPVLAAAAGLVRFAGQVAGRGLLVIAHPDGISTEYEPLEPAVAAGASVVAGQPIGRLAGPHPGCPAASCLHWGARRNGRYLDPLSLLRPLGVVRLLPWDGTPTG